MSIIQAHQLSYTYPKAIQPVLQDVSFDIEPGTVTALLGCSGSGKSTLLLAMAGIIPEFYGGKWSGTLRVGEVLIEADDARSPDVVEQVAIALQTPETQLIGFRVEETIAFALENQGIPPDIIRQRIQHVLDQLGIAHLRGCLAETLSGGQKQACVLAAILALDTPIIVLDEPTAALDPAGKELVGQIVERLAQLGKTLVISDQNLDWFQHLVDQTVVLNRTGSVLFQGDMREFLSDRELVMQSGIPIPSLAALAYELRHRGYGVDPWLRFTEAHHWIAHRIAPHRMSEASISADSNQSVREGDSNQGEPIATCVDVTYTYPGAPSPAIAHIHFTAYAGRMLGIIGQNGSGKSTAIRHLNGLLTSQQGTVIVAGHKVATMTVAQMAQWVGIAFQNPEFMLFNETVEHEIRFSLQPIQDSDWRQQRHLELIDLLRQFDLDQHLGRSPLALSVGEKQLLAILCASALNPAVLVLDEPTSGMDRRGREQLSLLIQQLQAQNTAVICISHDLPFLAERADEIVVFQSGRILGCRPTHDLLGDTDLFDQIGIPLPSYVQLANKFSGYPCRTPAELAHRLTTVVA